MEFKPIPQPQTVDETGVKRGLLEDLALKAYYLQGEMTLRDLCKYMHISLGIIKEIFDYLRKEQFCEIKGMAAGDFRITTTTLGKDRALELLSQSHYAGPAPVSYQEYVTRVRAQSVLDADVHPEDVAELAGAYTPVPGGVGPMLVTMLMLSTVQAAKMAAGLA